MDSIKQLYNTVINNNYCVGCGACAGLEDSSLRMILNDMGQYVPVQEDTDLQMATDVNRVCPFSAQMNEDHLGKELYEHQEGIKKGAFCGFYLKNHAGYVKKGSYRENGSSGGFGSWIVAKLLEEGMADYIIHVKETANNTESVFFEYCISGSVEEVSSGAKSKYYPIEMSRVLEYVRSHEGRYAFVGVPCYIKALRLVAKEDPIIRERVRYTVGLVCGHLKSDRFGKAMAWEIGIKPHQLKRIDYRVKIAGKAASEYGVEVMGDIEGKAITKSVPVRKLYTSDWGYGFFKLEACDYCDDIMAETADVTVGDAWLPEYVQDSGGTNIITIRSRDILNMFERHQEEIYLEDITEESVYEAQAGGFRHRREGLSYRLYKKTLQKAWIPAKRVEIQDIKDEKRKQLYDLRMMLNRESYQAYDIALSDGNFETFIKMMEPIRKEYEKLRQQSLPNRIMGKIRRILKNIR